VVRVAGSGHLIHDERASRDAYIEQLAVLLRRHACRRPAELDPKFTQLGGIGAQA
jgi:hypothetical protein